MKIDPTKPNAAGKTVADYLPAAAAKLGITLPTGPAGVNEEPVDALPTQEPPQTIDKLKVSKAVAILQKYKDGKRNLESRIKEEERWWNLRHWDIIREKGEAEGKDSKQQARPEPTSAWLFNSISNKHADMMDNFPEPNVLPREEMDEEDAQTLSSILPVIFERNNYEKTYSDAAWYKLKHGVVAKGVFWNKELEDGLGDIDIPFIDILNIFWEPGITNIQDSRNLFIVKLKDNDLLEQEYPQLQGKVGGHLIDIAEYVHDDQVDTSDKSVVVDWYYKKKVGLGKTIVHYCKFVGDQVLYASENDPEYAQRGYYDHGKYPVVFDVLFPEEGTPVGFGYIAIMKSPQMYIDKLSQVILENAVMYTKPRYFGKKSVGINKEQFLDLSQPIVDVEGDISEERFRPIEVKALDGTVLQVLQMKIDELKETSSNRDVSQGSSSGGVTAAAAIAALQEAGNKTSRDMIQASYRSYMEECHLSIELIRQFYDEQRCFRITGDTGKNEYIQYSNANLQDQVLPVAYEGQDLEPGYTPATRRPIFDIVVKPQKRSPYSKMAQNEMAKELYQMGFFNPQLAEQSLTALELMDFDGLEKVRDRVQQGQTLLAQMQQMQMMMEKMGLIIQALTGRDVLGGLNAPSTGPETAQNRGKPAKGGSMGQAQKAAQSATMTNYGQKLAGRAKPNMEGQ